MLDEAVKEDKERRKQHRTPVRRERKPKYPRLKKVLLDEVKYREEHSLGRDKETMRVWLQQKAKEIDEEEKTEKYTKFKSSRKFVLDTVHDAGGGQKRPTGKSCLTTTEYVEQWKPWINAERDFLIDNNYTDPNDGNKADLDLIDNLDEVPISFKSEAKMLQV